MSLHRFLDAPDARGPGVSGHLIGLAAGMAAALVLVLPVAWLWPEAEVGRVGGAFLLLGLGTVGTMAGIAALLGLARRQGRQLSSLTGRGFSAGSVFVGFSLFGLIGALFFAVVFWADGTSPVWRLDAVRVAYAGFGLAAMLAIAAAEEIVFRAYLPQGLHTRLPTGLAVLVTAVLFALLHGLGQGWTGVAYRIVLALAMFAAIAVTGNLGAAIGAHAANNLMALVMAPADQPGRVVALIELPASGDGLDAWSVATLALRCILFIVAMQLWQRYCHKTLDITERPI